MPDKKPNLKYPNKDYSKNIRKNFKKIKSTSKEMYLQTELSQTALTKENGKDRLPETKRKIKKKKLLNV